MAGLSASARRLYERLRPPGGEPGAAREAETRPGETDGASAVAAIEAWVCGEAVTDLSARSRLATAIGRQTSGLRAAAFLHGAELAASLDLLVLAASRRLPIVVHLTADGDHRAVHAAAASGAMVLFAADAQEAADLTWIARRAAEEAMAPAVVAMDAETALATRPVALPLRAAARRYLGDASELIHPPTPSQEMLFGKHRRRVPRWHDPGRPLLVGATGGGIAAAAAAGVYFDAHLPAILERAFEAFAEETGRRCRTLGTHRIRGAKLLLVAQGAAVATATAAADELRAAGGPRVGVVGIRALRPWPAAELAELLRGRRAVAVLQRLEAPALAEPTLAAEIRALLDRTRENRRFGEGTHPGLGSLREKELPRVTSAIYGLGAAPLRGADLAALCRALGEARKDLPALLYLGLDMTSPSAYPKEQAHRDALRRAYPEIARLGVAAAAPEDPDAARPDGEPQTVPPALRRLGRSTSPLADVPGFWGRVGSRSREAAGVSADPFLATRTVPPLTAALTPVGSAPLPVFDPVPCTGCGACWSACPEGAVGPLVIGPGALLEQGMRLAQRRGHSTDKLRMVVSKLADRVRRAVAQGSGGATAGELFDAAFTPLIDAMKLPDERREPLREAYMAVRDEIASLPIARTAPFFDGPEAEALGSGELLTLAIDPDACKGCGLCVAECEPQALTPGREGDPASAARELWHLLEELPAPGEATLERARRHPEAGPLAGALLSRQARQSMVAVRDSEAGSGEVLAARQVVAAAAARLLPLRERQIAETQALREELAAAIHRGLADALPDRDLDALARGLDALDEPDADLAKLTERVETAFESERVDVARTRGLVAAARSLADVVWRFEAGESGFGRAPFGLVVAGSAAAWAGAFPDNPFAVPVTVDPAGTAVETAAGILDGQIDGALAAVRALRRARAELERLASGSRRAPEPLEELSWGDLGPEERQLCPPVLVLAPEPSLASATDGVLASLAGERPLKLIALSDGASPADVPIDLGVLALTGAGAFVAQTSIAHRDHLAGVVDEALAYEGPAFVRVLAPSPSRGGFATDATLETARRAVAEGDFPLWRSPAPERSGASVQELLTASKPETAAGAGAPEEAPPAPAKAAVDGAAAELEERHQAEIAALRADYEARIAQLSTGLRMEMAQRVRHRLLALLARGAPPAEPGNGKPTEVET